LGLFQNQEMLTEGDLANSMEQTDKVREMQDKIARLRAQVSKTDGLKDWLELWAHRTLGLIWFCVQLVSHVLMSLIRTFSSLSLSLPLPINHFLSV
jgi:hypothetical protein